MAKPKKLPSGNYRIRITVGTSPDGKPIRKSITAATAKECKVLAAQYESEHRKPARMTVEAVLRSYLDSGKATLAPGTVRGHNAYFKAWQQFPRIMNSRPDDVSAEDVQQAINTMAVEKTPKGNTVSPKTIRERYHFLTKALRKYHVDLSEVRLPAKSRTEIDVPDDTRMKEIFAAAKGTALEIPIMLAAIGGLRRGEICALKWPEDFSGNVLHVHSDMVIDENNQWIIKEIPKTYESNRYVEMPPQVIDLIREQGYVCDIHPNALTARHNRFLKRHGFPHSRFHDYRHHMASALHAAGVPDQYIIQRLGHSGDSTLKRVYRHTLADHERAAVTATLDHFDSLLS
jgi:integrase